MVYTAITEGCDSPWPCLHALLHRWHLLGLASPDRWDGSAEITRTAGSDGRLFPPAAAGALRHEQAGEQGKVVTF